MSEWWLAYLVLGAFVGFFSGLLGIGGGSVIIRLGRNTDRILEITQYSPRSRAGFEGLLCRSGGGCPKKNPHW